MKKYLHTYLPVIPWHNLNHDDLKFIRFVCRKALEHIQRTSETEQAQTFQFEVVFSTVCSDPECLELATRRISNSKILYDRIHQLSNKICTRQAKVTGINNSGLITFSHLLKSKLVEPKSEAEVPRISVHKPTAQFSQFQKVQSPIFFSGGETSE